METLTDERRYLDKQNEVTDWAQWCMRWQEGAEHAAKRQSPRAPSQATSGEGQRLVWHYVAYLSGYCYGGEPDRDLFNRAWKQRGWPSKQ